MIIGAMKSGTTSLFDILAQHSKIAAAYPKEPGFFAFPDIYEKGFEWYHSLFDFDETTHTYRLDGSTDYTKSPYVTGVWDRMKARPNARYKLIYIMRDPVKRLESHARHVQAGRKEIGQKISPRPDHGLDSGLSLVNLSISQYAQQLAPYVEAWDAGDLFLTTLEDFTENPSHVINDVLAFLGLGTADMPTVQSSHSNAATAKTRTHGVWQSLTKLSWLMALGRTLLPKRLRETVKNLFQVKIKAEGRFKFTPEEEQTLHQAFANDVKQIEDHYGIHVKAHWKQ